MQRFIVQAISRATPRTVLKYVYPVRGLATEAHPNPGNFANRPKHELRQIGRRGGQKGGKARGVGGFRFMDPVKQHEIASRGGRAVNKKAARDRRRRGSYKIEPETRGFVVAKRPSAASPGFDESWTA